MTQNDFLIREIHPKDNKQIAQVIRDVLIEFGVPKVGTAYEDKSLDAMFETYDSDKKTYFVIEHQQKIVGGCGIAPLDNHDGNTCELQKMYFLPIARGKGLGSKMIAKCIKKAKEFNFDSCYLETLPYMKSARALYKKNGFISLENRMGDTGHYSCNLWMLKKL